MDLTRLERAVLEMFLSGDHPALAQLRQQLPTCQVASRAFTGIGFITELHCGASKEPYLFFDVVLNDVYAQIEGLDHGAGFLLFVKGGRLDGLEGYCYVDSWPDSIGNFELEYANRQERDIAKLQLPPA
jgi:hypothetical protein